MANTGAPEPEELEDQDDPAGIPAGAVELTGPPPVPAADDDERDIDPDDEQTGGTGW